jgi:hypothetical protein
MKKAKEDNECVPKSGRFIAIIHFATIWLNGLID